MSDKNVPQLKEKETSKGTERQEVMGPPQTKERPEEPHRHCPGERKLQEEACEGAYGKDGHRYKHSPEKGKHHDKDHCEVVVIVECGPTHFQRARHSIPSYEEFADRKMCFSPTRKHSSWQERSYYDRELYRFDVYGGSDYQQDFGRHRPWERRNAGCYPPTYDYPRQHDYSPIYDRSYRHRPVIYNDNCFGSGSMSGSRNRYPDYRYPDYDYGSYDPYDSYDRGPSRWDRAFDMGLAGFSAFASWDAVRRNTRAGYPARYGMGLGRDRYRHSRWV